MSGRDLLRSDGQIRAGIRSGLRSCGHSESSESNYVAPYMSHVRLFGFGKHRTLRLELELSRAFVNSVGKNARNRDGGTWNGHISVSRVHETRIGTLFSF